MGHTAALESVENEEQKDNPNLLAWLRKSV
jgi:hypothetical protein